MKKNAFKIWSACLFAAFILTGCQASNAAVPDGSVAQVSQTNTASALSRTPAAVGAAQKSAAQKAAPPAAGINGYYGALQVNGTALSDKDKTPVQLKGISSHGLGWFPEYVTRAGLKEFKESWNMNVFRLAMYTEEYNGYVSSGKAQQEKLKSVVHTGIQAAQELDLYVIVDWHILKDGNPLTHVKEAEKFFGEISAKYKNDPHIIYEICNEPNGGTSWADIKKYANQIIPVIRKNAPDAVIIVGTPTWSQDVDIAADSPITGHKNIMYALHFYADTHRDNLRSKMVRALDKGLPIFVSEYGICDASGSGPINKTEADRWIALLDKHKISHVAWNLSNKQETSAVLKSSTKKVSGFTAADLSDSGLWLKTMLTKTGAGSPAPESPATTPAPKAPEAAAPANDVLIETVETTAGTTAAIRLDGSWEEGGKTHYLYRLELKNAGDQLVSGWSIALKTKSKVELVNNWNCAAAVKDGKVTLTPAAYNGEISTGSSAADLGIIVKLS